MRSERSARHGGPVVPAGRDYSGVLVVHVVRRFLVRVVSAVGALLVAWFAAASLFLAVGAAVAPISRFERLLCALAAVAGAVSAVLVVGGALR